MAIPRQHPGLGQREPVSPRSSDHAEIADLLSDMVSIHAPDGTFRFASAATRELLGYHPSELVGSSSYEYLHPEDVSRIEIAHRSALEGLPYTVAYRFRRKSGEYVWVETTTKVVRDEGGGEIDEIVCSTRPAKGRPPVEGASAGPRDLWLRRIEGVLEEEAIEIVFQPVLELRSRRAVAYEALSRFPGDSSLTPDRWFSEAWEVGLGLPLELLAVKRAAEALDRLPDATGLNVNASPPVVAAESFLATFEGTAERVTVELTEHLRIEDYRSFTSALDPMRRAGGQIAIDDFGAGYASLRHMLRLRPEWVKLDISITERIDENPMAHEMAAALISFADNVGMRVIAEGIETEEELDALVELGFRYGQGFHFGVPGPLDEALAAFS
jgi:PAS domain S-box-containing protein